MYEKDGFTVLYFKMIENDYRGTNHSLRKQVSVFYQLDINTQIVKYQMSFANMKLILAVVLISSLIVSSTY